MKTRVLLFVSLCALGVGALQAAPVLAPPVPQCASIPGVGGNANDLIFAFATWAAPNFACEQQDKIYSNFSTGALPNDTTLRLQLQPLGLLEFHTVTINGNFDANFVFSYDIAIDLTLNALNRITAVSGDISNPSNQGAPSNLKTVFTEGGTLLGSITSTASAPGLPLFGISETALHVVDTYTTGGGAAVSVSNTFRQDLTGGTPEPVSYALIGGGLLLLAGMRRYRRA